MFIEDRWYFMYRTEKYFTRDYLYVDSLQSKQKPSSLWRDYYGDNRREIELLKSYSYSDRIRHYRADKTVPTALIEQHVQRCAARYFNAAGFRGGSSSA